MSPKLVNISQEALSLNPKEKEILIQSLVSSLENEPITDFDEAWIIEAEKRYDQYKKGLTKGIPGEKIFADIRRELGWQK